MTSQPHTARQTHSTKTWRDHGWKVLEAACKHQKFSSRQQQYLSLSTFWCRQWHVPKNSSENGHATQEAVPRPATDQGVGNAQQPTATRYLCADRLAGKRQGDRMCTRNSVWELTEPCLDSSSMLKAYAAVSIWTSLTTKTLSNMSRELNC